MATTQVSVQGLTDVGQKRRINEDSHAWWIPDRPEDLEARGILLVVADGMGGAQAGEHASRLAVDTVLEVYLADGAAPLLEQLKISVETANHRIHTESSGNPDLSGMGTTCTALAIRNGSVFVAHVGDSRAYLVRQGKVSQLTHDHSLVAQLVATKQITAEEAKVDPRRNVVTRSVGVSATVQVDAEEFTGLLAGDSLVLCSDGLHGQVTDEEIALLVHGKDPAEACRRLVSLANDRGGPDNITVLLARVERVAPAPDPLEETRRP